jgi:hypothetical protein
MQLLSRNNSANSNKIKPLKNLHFQDTEQDAKQPPKIPPFHLSKQSPEIISQKFDCSNEF